MSTGTSPLVHSRAVVPATTTSPRHSAFRQRLIEAEAGARLVLRADGTLFFHAFVCCAVVTSGIVLGLSLVEWALLLICFSVVLFAEIARAMAQRFVDLVESTEPDQVPPECRQPAPKVSIFPRDHNEESRTPSSIASDLVRLATAGTVITSLCSITIAALLLGSRLWSLFSTTP